MGRMSMNANEWSSSRSTLAGVSRRAILQKMQVGSAVGGTARAKSRGSLNLATVPEWCRSLLRGWPQDPLRDHELLDLVRALVQAQDSRVAEQPLLVELAAEP